MDWSTPGIPSQRNGQRSVYKNVSSKNVKQQAGSDLEMHDGKYHYNDTSQERFIITYKIFATILSGKLKLQVLCIVFFQRLWRQIDKKMQGKC